MPTLHALLISLSEYPNPQDNLPGCASDFVNMKKHLDVFCEKKGYAYKPKELVNAQATRKGIIEGYKHFLGAKRGDTCLVYYTGHGYQIRAAQEFWLETDGFLEALYCYDAGEKKGLTDKELAHLGWKYVGAQNEGIHFVEIFDCCHSGGNTRGEVGGKKTGPVARRKQRDVGAVQPLERYFGYKEYDGYLEYSKDKTKPARIQPKLAKRIHLAAAKADETAKEDEINGERAGFFTHSLCKVLEETNYTVSYAELMDRIWFKVKELARPSISYMGDQTPLSDCEKASLHLLFGTGGPTEQVSTVGFDGKRKKWVLRAGATNGIPPEGETKIEIKGKKGIFKLGKVHPDVSEIVDLPANLDQDKTYRATIQSITWDGKKKLAFHSGVAKAQWDAFMEAWEKTFPKAHPNLYLELEKDAANADFLVRYENGYFLTKADSGVPLFKRQQAGELSNFFVFTESVIKWQQAKEIENPKSKITDKDLEIKVETFTHADDYKTGEAEDWKQPIECRYALQDNELAEARIAISVKNRSGRDLYVGFLWLASDFSIVHDLLPGGQANLHPGDTAKMAYENEEKIYVSIPDELREFGVPEVVEHVKIFASTEPLTMETYRQSALPMDEALKRSGEKGITARPSSQSREKKEANDQSDWNAFTLTVQIVCPDSKNKLTGSNPVEIEGTKLTAPTGFSAEVDLASALAGKRAAGNQPPALRNQAALSDFHLSAGKRSTAVPSNAIQFRNVKNPDLVTADTPLKLDLGKKASAPNERVVALGYDPETGMYFPTGMEDDKGVLQITQLPPALPDGRRSLGGAIVMFLKKVVMENIQPEKSKSLYKLRLVTPGKDVEAKPHYEEDPEKIKTAIKDKQRLLLVMHGIIGDTAEQVKLTQRLVLRQPYDALLAFDFENLDTEIEKIAGELQAKLAAIGLAAGHGKTLHVVAHSLGGLVSRWFVEQMKGSEVVSRLVLVGTPNGGSPWGTVAQFGTVAATFAMNYLTFAQPAQLALNLLGKYGNRALTTLKQMRPGSPFLKELNGGKGSNVPYFIVAGNLLDITADKKRQSFFKRLTLRLMKGVGSTIFGSPNDIAVSVDNIKLVSFVPADSMQEIACDHLSYFTDERGLAALEVALNQP